MLPSFRPLSPLLLLLEGDFSPTVPVMFTNATACNALIFLFLCPSLFQSVHLRN